MKNNKNKILIPAITSTFVSTVLFFGIFSSIYFPLRNYKNNSYIELHFGENSKKIYRNEFNLFENKYLSNSNSPITREGTSDITTNKEKFAEYISKTFMTYSLSGIINDEIWSSSIDNTQKDGFILTPTSEDSWIKSRQFLEGENYDSLSKQILYQKIYNKTDGSDKTFFDFVFELVENYDLKLIDENGDNTALGNYWNDLEKAPVQVYDFWNQIKNPNFVNVIDQIWNTRAFEEEIDTFLYVYSYLWQESLNSHYDYKITEKLVKDKISFLWAIDFETKNNFFNDYLPISSEVIFKSIRHEFLEGDKQWITDWNKLLNHNYGDKIEYYTFDEDGNVSSSKSEAEMKFESKNIKKFDKNGLNGFKGIINKTESLKSTVKSDFYDPYKIWKIEDGGKSISLQKDSNLNNLGKDFYTNKDKEFFQSSDSTKYLREGEDVIDGGDGTDGGGEATESKYSVYFKQTIYPFIFPEVWDSENETASSWNYYFDVYIDPSKKFYENNDDLGSLTKVNLLDIIFEDIDVNGDGDADENDKNIVEIFLIDNIINSYSKDAFNYWKRKGFYIELSGSIENNYGSLINENLLK